MNVPVITQPAQTVTVNTPVYTQPTTTISLTGTAIPITPPPGSAPPAAPAAAPATVPVGQLRPLFQRGQTHEVQVLKALNYGSYGNQVYLNGQMPFASTLSPLDRGFAQLAMLAAEAYYSQQPVTTDGALAQMGSVSDPRARQAVTGILGLLLVAKMSTSRQMRARFASRLGHSGLSKPEITASKASLDQSWRGRTTRVVTKENPRENAEWQIFLPRHTSEGQFALRAMGTMLSNNTAQVAGPQRLRQRL